MKTLKVTSISLIIITYLTSCNYYDFDLNSNYPEELINVWVASYEESPEIFRPSDYKEFPVSHFRQVYVFKKSNECEYLVSSPVDAHYLDKGFWEYIEEDHLIKIYNSQQKLIKEFKVKNYSSELLQLKQIR
mgnify:CR=1 FL=1